MRLISFYLFIMLGLLFCVDGKAQISIKTEYIGSSAYMYSPNDMDASSVKVGDCSGSAVVYQGMANLPISMKIDENGKMKIWGVGLGASYASLNNKKFSDDMVSDILNMQLAVFHMRPLNEKWSLMANVGVGSFTPFTNFSQIRYTHVLGSVGAVFIRHLNPNLDIGGGLAINSAFGYPMAFPALYLNWNYEGKFKANVSVGEGLELSAGYNFNDYFTTSLAVEMNGQMALLEKDGKDVIFSHQYLVVGLRPEIKLGKSGLSVPIMIGINAYRPAYYDNRTLKSMFNFNADNDYYFRVSPYASAGIRYGF